MHPPDEHIDLTPEISCNQPSRLVERRIGLCGDQRRDALSLVEA